MSGPFPDRMRLDRMLSHATGLSRSWVKPLLRSGRVDVNAASMRNAAHVVCREDCIALDGNALEWPRQHYVMLNKPRDYVCSAQEDGHPPVNQLIDVPWCENLHSAGRLDADTTGLVLLTDDGQWSHRITSPRSGCVKQYRATLRDPVSDETLEAFTKGMLLKGESNLTLPAQIEVLSPCDVRVHISEGRYHQVKRMFGACSNRVESLHRECIGTLCLDPSLEPGDWRELTPEEVEEIL